MNSKTRTIVASCLLGAVVIALVLFWLPGGSRKVAGLAESDDPAKRLQAIDMLRGAGGDSAREVLTNLAGDPNPGVSLAAITALGATDDESYRQPLQDLLTGSSDPRARARAAAGLGRHKAFPTDELVKLMATDKDAVVRAGAAEGLSHRRDMAAIDGILKAMDDKELPVRSAAMGALHKTVGLRFLYKATDPQRLRTVRIRQIRRYLKGMDSHEHH